MLSGAKIADTDLGDQSGDVNIGGSCQPEVQGTAGKEKTGSWRALVFLKERSCCCSALSCFSLWEPRPVLFGLLILQVSLKARFLCAAFPF